jgi:hypothetical protein
VERSLHRQLKERYGPELGGRSEVVLDGFRIDALGSDGRLIEIQSGSLGPLKHKLARLLPTREVSVVKPVILSRRVIRRKEVSGLELGSKRSPKRGAIFDVFEDLVGVVHLFPHANLRIELLAVEIDEIRVPRRRRPGYQVIDRVLREVGDIVYLRHSEDLWRLLPDDLPERFTTRELAERIGRSQWFGQRVAYCLRHSGAAEVVSKVGNQRVYSRKTGEGLGRLPDARNQDKVIISVK